MLLLREVLLYQYLGLGAAALFIGELQMVEQRLAVDPQVYIALQLFVQSVVVVHAESLALHQLLRHDVLSLQSFKVDSVNIEHDPELSEFLIVLNLLDEL